MTYASWHIFKCHNALWLFENSHNTTFRVMAVSLMPQRVVVVFSAHWAFSIFERNIYTASYLISMPNSHDRPHACWRNSLSGWTDSSQGVSNNASPSWNTTRVSFRKFLPRTNSSIPPVQGHADKDFLQISGTPGGWAVDITTALNFTAPCLCDHTAYFLTVLPHSVTSVQWIIFTTKGPTTHSHHENNQTMRIIIK